MKFKNESRELTPQLSYDILYQK